MRHAFTEWKIICRHRTPYQVQQFLNRLPYNHEKPKETLRSFRGVVRSGSAHCLEAALSAAVILEQHGPCSWIWNHRTTWIMSCSSIKRTAGGAL
ncbi:MAG: hypothetical protein JRJ65_09735 [Deltaproteobacteria bacterium]|nr:hypothetical protein [Deltaproteobacteria bacterium]